MGYRLAQGGHIDRTQSFRFRWNGRALSAFAGDTVASALLANNVRIVGRSMKFHRPRGLLSAGVEEPNALVTLGHGAECEPTARATMIPVSNGLNVRAQNAWPGIRFDLGRIFDMTAPLWPAGFYNKTFTWPSWHFYEPWIRRVAGLAAAPRQPDPARYDAVNAHCDLLVVGGGPAGLLAAQIAARAGLVVLLAEQDFECGASLLGSAVTINDAPPVVWLASVLGELAASRNVTLLNGTTCFGLYDHGTAGLVQRLDLQGPERAASQRYWRIHARQVLLATGAIEQPLVFERNDLPGMMLAGAVRQYANRYGVAAGRRVAFATNNDSAYLAALDLAVAGVAVAHVLDSRKAPPPVLAEALRERGVEVSAGTTVLQGRGHRSLRGVVVNTNGDEPREVACDALGMSGGWAPALHLYSQTRSALVYEAGRRCYLPRDPRPPLACAGALAGCVTLAQTLADASRAAYAALAQAGKTQEALVREAVVEEPPVSAEVGATRFAPAGRGSRQWLDFQHDVTVADVEIAIAEGFDHIELVKRYTTAGMSVDQGKTGNLNTLLAFAELTGRMPADLSMTTYRPPYTPVALGAIAARQTGERYAPRRLMPAHDAHVTLGAHWWEAGGWMRPACYPRQGESLPEAVRREAIAVRTSAGIFDASPLGKIEVTGPDAARFLDWFYINNVRTLKPGRLRYGLMLNEAGVVIDDGTIARLGPGRFVVTTTSGGATRIAAWLEEWRQCEWPQMKVFVVPVTTQWAAIALSGPCARDVLSCFETDIAIDAESLPHMSVREGRFAGVETRLYRVSFSGELGYEIHVPARYGNALWEALMSAGAGTGIAPYGIETLLLLRLEKGFLHVGVDTDSTSTPADVGWGDVAARKAADFIGKRSLGRTDNRRADRLQLIGLTAAGPDLLQPGAHLRFAGTTEGSDGWVTSAAMSPNLDRPIALALLRGGRARLGETVTVHDLDRQGPATVVPTSFYDPEGERLHA
jgi:sarcosine oxidase subunit alpha